MFMIHKIVLLQIKTQTGLSETINQRTGNAIPGRKQDIGKKWSTKQYIENNRAARFVETFIFGIHCYYVFPTKYNENYHAFIFFNA